MKRYILTGTPGAGKTTLIRALTLLGHSVVPEAATDIIALKQKQGIATPWEEAGFIDAIVGLQQRRLKKIHQQSSKKNTSAIQFHDRSVICCYALARYQGRAPSSLLLAELERIKRENVFQRDVFFIRTLGFCEPTAARKISFEQSLVFEQVHMDVYQELGYRLVEIEKDTVEKRLNKILSFVIPTERSDEGS